MSNILVCSTLVSVLFMATPRLLLVCTTLVCVLFVATPTSTIGVYYKGVRQFYHNIHTTLLKLT